MSDWFAELQQLGAELLQSGDDREEKDKKERLETKEQRAQRFREGQRQLVEEALKDSKATEKVSAFMEPRLEEKRRFEAAMEKKLDDARKERAAKQAIEAAQAAEPSPPLVLEEYSDEEHDSMRQQAPWDILTRLHEDSLRNPRAIPEAGLEIFRLVHFQSCTMGTLMEDWKTVFQENENHRMVLIYLLNELAKQQPQLPNLHNVLRSLLAFVAQLRLPQRQRQRIATWVFCPSPTSTQASAILNVRRSSPEWMEFITDWRDRMVSVPEGAALQAEQAAKRQRVAPVPTSAPSTSRISMLPPPRPTSR